MKFFKTKQSKFNRGFTLIELLVAMSIFVITIFAISQIFIAIVNSEKLAYSLLDAENTIRNNIEYMARAIRMGTNFTVTDQNRKLSFTNSNGSSQTFEFADAIIYQTLGSSRAPLIDKNISETLEISQGHFYIVESSERPQPMVVIQVLANAKYRDQTYQFRVETSVTRRTFK